MTKINIWTVVNGRPQKTTEVNFLKSIGQSPDRLNIRNRNGKAVSGQFSPVTFSNTEQTPVFDWRFIFDD